jgi:hypothetical protein
LLFAFTQPAKSIGIISCFDRSCHAEKSRLYETTYSPQLSFQKSKTTRASRGKNFFKPSILQKEIACLFSFTSLSFSQSNKKPRPNDGAENAHIFLKRGRRGGALGSSQMEALSPSVEASIKLPKLGYGGVVR